MTENPATPPDGPNPDDAAVGEGAPTLSGLPDDAPPELRATLAGGDLGHIPTDVERGDGDR